MGDVTILGLDAITEKSGHTIVPMAVSVCITPAAPSPLPIPYPVVGSSIEGITDSPLRTKINGALIATVGSVIKTCHGNEPGTLKEVVSLNTTGPCALIIGAPIVLIELGMAGITGSICVSNKAPTPGAGGSASDAGGAGSAGGGGGEGSGSGGNASGPGGPGGGGGAGGGGSNTGASAPGSSSGAADGHTCQDGHPVNVVTGHVVDQATDLAIPGLIPLVWKRYYSSVRRQDTTATLGPGWAHGFERRITEEERTITLRDGEGRSIYFAKIGPGESTFHRRERMSLEVNVDGTYRVHSLNERSTQVFSRERAGGPALLREIRDAHENAIRLEYEGARLARILDTAGRVVSVAWKQGRIVRLEVRAEGKLEQWVDYDYAAAGCLVSAVDTLGGTEEYEYDRFHRMSAATIKAGARFQYEYEADTGRCARTWGPDGLYAIDLRADKAARTTEVLGEEPRIYTWNDQGVMTREALPDGTVIQERAYDEDGFLVAQVNGAGEGEQHWYDVRGNRIRTVDAAGNVTATEYDAQNLPLRSVTADGLVTSFGHDAKGALTSVAYPSGQSYSLTYDVRGRLTSIHDAQGLVRGLDYDSQHNVLAETDARGARTTYEYDGMGRPVTRTDALGRITRVTYDRLGRRLTVRLPDGTTSQTAYDPIGNPVRETDALGQITKMDYAGMGVLARLTEPGGQVWSFKHTSKERLKEIKNPRGEVYAFTYDDAGRVIEEKTFDGRALRYGWTEAGRIARIDYLDRSFRSFTHDRTGRMVGEEASDKSAITYQRDRVGRLLGAVLNEDGQRVQTLFERDALGRVVTERQGDRTVRFGYDARGRRSLRVMPDGATTRYAYDAADALTRVEHNGYTLMIERDALGREIRRSNGEGRLTIQSGYDAMDRLIEQRATAPSPGEGVPAVLVQRQWEYDRNGRVKRIDDARWGATAYRHDALGQLLSAARGTHREVFAYNGAGSLIQTLAGLDAPPTPARVNAWKVAPGNLLSQTDKAKYAYDARGRRTGQIDRTGEDPAREGITEYRWDCRDRLREVRLPSGDLVKLTYDALGRRVKKEVLDEAGRARVIELVWDGDALAADIDSERGARGFVHAPGTLIPLLQQERAEVLAYVNDHLGTPKELIDPAGRVAWAAAHSAWGKVVETHADPQSELKRGRKVSSPFRLLGQYADEETGLCCTRFRYFDPEVGRWCSPDPLGIAGGKDLFGFNGSPTWATDPFGLSTGTPHIQPHDSEAAARRAAMREAGMGKHGPQVTTQVPERPGSQAPEGDRGMRTEIHDPTRPNGPSVHHDPWGHSYPDGATIPPHWGVDHEDGSTSHHTYPSNHDPRTNR